MGSAIPGKQIRLEVHALSRAAMGPKPGLAWLARLISRRERPEDFAPVLERHFEDIKVGNQFAGT